MNDFDGRLVDWMRKDLDISSYSEFLQKHFSLSENDIKKMEPKEKKKRKRRKK